MNTLRTRRRQILALPMFVALASSVCGDPPVAPLEQGPPTITANAGMGQEGEAGGVVPVAPSVRLAYANGTPASGVAVTFSVSQGNGTVTGATATTDANGVATAGSWTLGTTAGRNELSAGASKVTGSPLAIVATGKPGPAAKLVTTSVGMQTASINAAVAAPSVKVTDINGNAVPGVGVTFVVTGGGGTLSLTSGTSNTAGLASPGGWTLGPAVGVNALSAVATGIAMPLTLSAVATAPGVAAPLPAAGSVVGVGSTSLSDDKLFSIGVPTGATLLKITTSGGTGDVDLYVRRGGVPTPSAYDCRPFLNGNAETCLISSPAAGTWFILMHTFTPFSGVTLTVEASPNEGIVPVTVAAVAGDKQAAMVSTAIPTAPSVMVSGSNGPVVGATVTFAVGSGGGSVTGGTTTTNASGVATVGTWTLGPAGSVNTLVATVASPGASPTTFTAAGCTGGDGGTGYAITVCYASDMTTSQRAAFADAAARWSTLITGDLPDQVLSTASLCSGGTAINTTVDDLVILASIEPIDGPSGVLGQSGPCQIRSLGLLPFSGLMRFDIADVGTLEGNSQLGSVILHEMGHVLGIGSLWSTFSVLKNPSTAGLPPLDTYFSGANGIAGFDAIGGATYTGGQKVPVENQFFSGTINAHWRESVLANELMTGFLQIGVANPLSVLTVRSLQDLGYTVNSAGADAFSLTLTAPAGKGATGPSLSLVNDQYTGPVTVVDKRGQVTRIIR